MAEVLSDPQVQHLGLIEEVEHAKAGKLKFVGPAVSYAKLSTESAKPPPLLGEQTALILAELGCGAEEVRGMVEQGIVKTAATDT
jgi:succinate--hydroxymethylglutarate CoA-transferase